MATSDILKVDISQFSVNVLYDSKNRSSFCWKYFGILVLHTNNKKKRVLDEQVFCNICLINAQNEYENVTFGSMKIKSYSKTVSTGNFIRHLRDDHRVQEDCSRDKKPAKNSVKTPRAPSRPRTKSSTSAHTSEQPAPQVDTLKLARDMALWFCQSLIPLDYTSDAAMMDFFKAYKIVTKNEEFPSRHTIARSALDGLYEAMLSHVMKVLQLDGSFHGALSFDFWSDRYRQRNYLTSTYHYLTEKFKLKSFTLLTSAIEDIKSGQSMCDIIFKLKSSFRLHDKSIFAVTDSRYSAKHAISLASLNGHLCLGHGLHNLVIVDGIQSIPEADILVRKITKIIRTLYLRLSDLEDGEEEKELISSIATAGEYLESDENDPGFGVVPAEENHDIYSTFNYGNDNTIIKQAIPTRWHSILQILESLNLCGNPDSVNRLLAKIGKEELILDCNDWNLIGDLTKFLLKFKDTVKIMSSQETSSLNVALVFRSEIKYTLKSLPDDESMTMLTLKNNMLAKLDHRLPITKPIIAATLLDCRFQGIQEVDEYLRTNNETRVSFLASYIKEVVRTLDVEGGEVEHKPSSSFLIKLSRKHSQIGSQISEDPIEEECWKYFVSANPHSLLDGDLLKYWYDNRLSFPWLASLARSILCIPATSTPSERIFSNAGVTISAKRSRLCPNHVNKMIFIHDNYKYCKDFIK